jgi:23S rRNA (cytidine1920-2'-O)/16S rRNA (cytidine1409-2'-O)-methyltransferase
MDKPLTRLDQAMVARQLVASRSQAASYIKLGMVKLHGKSVTKPGLQVAESETIVLDIARQYVNRAALKLESVIPALSLRFNDAVVLDVGSSTGGFTDFALQHGARSVIAVDVGTNQLHPRLRDDQRIELHEKTDIRDFRTSSHIDIVLADVSFISLRDILPSVVKLCSADTEIIAMVKPQFESAHSRVKHHGVIKNDTIRRRILKEFENWSQAYFLILAKADSEITGAKGNKERFYKLKLKPSAGTPSH